MNHQGILSYKPCLTGLKLDCSRMNQVQLCQELLNQLNLNKNNREVSSK
mgnify:CR=1 FL=1